MASTDYIVDPTDAHRDTMNLNPGHYRARLGGRDSPWVLVHAEVVEDRDATGDLMADVEYRLKIGQNFILDWNAKFPHGLPGTRITKEQYDADVIDHAWIKENWGVEPGAPADLTKLPPIRPPGA